MRFNQDRNTHRETSRATVEFATVKQGSPQGDAWPWELQAPAFWQSGARFWNRKRKTVNPFEAALEYVESAKPASNSWIILPAQANISSSSTKPQRAASQPAAQQPAQAAAKSPAQTPPKSAAPPA